MLIRGDDDTGMMLRNPSIHDGQHVRWNITLFWSLLVDLVHAQNGTPLPRILHLSPHDRELMKSRDKRRLNETISSNRFLQSFRLPNPLTPFRYPRVLLPTSRRKPFYPFSPFPSN